MRRSAKFGLYAAVLAGLIGGCLVWANTEKKVTLSIDGHTRSVHTSAATVGAALRGLKVAVGQHDVVAPSADARVHNGSLIEFRHGRLLKLSIDGQERDVWTTDATVEDALQHLGYGAARPEGVSRAHRLPLSPSQISIVTPKQITLVSGGKTQTVLTTAPNVGSALGELSMSVGALDRISVPLSTKPRNGLKVVIQRVTTTVRTVAKKIPYKTVSKADPSAYKGTTTVITKGRTGTARVTYQYFYLDGKLLAIRAIWTIPGAQSRTQIQKVGTKAKPSSSSGSTGGGSYSPTPVGEAQTIAKQLVTARGWDGNEFGCLVNLWNRESHWNTHAANSSGAYGIPQALPGSKMASAGPDWQNNATTQIKWGLGYIASRYDTPCGAWAHSQATGWY